MGVMYATMGLSTPADHRGRTNKDRILQKKRCVHTHLDQKSNKGCGEGMGDLKGRVRVCVEEEEGGKKGRKKRKRVVKGRKVG